MLIKFLGDTVGGPLFIIFAIWLQFPLVVKRWHDMNKLSWWYLGSFIPICSIRLLFIKGTDEPNRFGEQSIAVKSLQLSNWN
jgi:uncharacterized membrane protein YhaH (DUF805 family)